MSAGGLLALVLVIAGVVAVLEACSALARRNDSPERDVHGHSGHRP